MKKRFLICLLPLLFAIPVTNKVATEVIADGQSTIYYTTSDISFISSSVSLDVYSTYQASVRNEELTKIVNWSSSDIGVATITSTGLITSKTTGQTVISASYGKLSSSFTLNVFSSSSASYIELSDTSVNLVAGDSYTVDASLIFKNEECETHDLLWSSSNESVCLARGSGNACTITALTAGQSQVVVSTVYNGCHINAAIDVNVYEENVSICVTNTKFALSNGTYELEINKNDYVSTKAEVIVNGQVSKIKPTWSSDDSSIASVDENGVIKGVSSGETYVYGNYQNKNTVIIHVTVK